MSDEELIPFPEPRPSYGEEPDLDPTVYALRRALDREAEQVRPSPDGLSRIMAVLDAERPAARRSSRTGRIRPGRPPLRRFTPLLAAAAAAGILAVAGTAVVQIEARHADVNQPGHTARVTAPAPTASSTDGVPTGLAVYVVAVQDGRMALFRELRTTTSTDPDQRVSEALTDAVDDPPKDPDYVTLFSGASPGRVVAHVTPDLITVQITAAMATRPTATLDEARMALQQLVWTATATAGETLPVKVTVTAGEQRLFGLLPLDRAYQRGSGAADPRAPVWIITLGDGTTLGRGNNLVSGDAVSQGDGTLDWSLQMGAIEVQTGTASIVDDLGQPIASGHRGNWTIDIDVSKPGDYRLVVSEPSDPSSAATPWQDTKTFLVN